MKLSPLRKDYKLVCDAIEWAEKQNGLSKDDLLHLEQLKIDKEELEERIEEEES